MSDRAEMYEKFTDRARKVLQLANQEAIGLQHEYIGTEHILLGITAEATGVAAIALMNLGVDGDAIRREIVKILGSGAIQTLSGRYPQTPRAKKVIECAIDEAKRLKHDYVGTEHLLLGMLQDTDGVAAQVLINLGLRLERVRDEVLTLLGLSVVEANPKPERPPDPEPDTKHMPAYAREIAQAFGVVITLVERGKEGLVADQDFDRAAALRDLEKRLKKYRDRFINEWPNSGIKET